MQFNTIRPKMYFFILVVPVVFLLMTGCNGSITPQRYVHKAVAIMDKSALYAEGPLWDEAKKRALLSSPETMDEAYETVREALETAGGKHSFLMESSVAQYNDTAQWEMPAIEMTEDSILVVTVPQFAGNETKAKQYAQTLQDGISSEARNVILDLRGNTGGNMYPMIAGVNALLPDGIVLKFRQRNGRESNLTAEYIAKVQGVEQCQNVRLADCRLCLRQPDLRYGRWFQTGDYVKLRCRTDRGSVL